MCMTHTLLTEGKIYFCFALRLRIKEQGGKPPKVFCSVVKGKRRVKTFAFGLLILSIMTIGMGVSPYFILYLVMMFVYSIALTMIQTATTTIIQEKTQESMLGRVFGLMGATYSGFLPIGMAILGPLADIFPLQWIMVGSGIALLLIGASQAAINAK